jgi:hypothetical protein
MFCLETLGPPRFFRLQSVSGGPLCWPRRVAKAVSLMLMQSAICAPYWMACPLILMSLTVNASGRGNLVNRPQRLQPSQDASRRRRQHRGAHGRRVTNIGGRGAGGRHGAGLPRLLRPLRLYATTEMKTF